MKRKKPEATAPWSGVKGVSVNPEGESCHGQARAKMARKERWNQTKMGEKVEGETPGDESTEVQSPKRKVLRVRNLKRRRIT